MSDPVTFTQDDKDETIGALSSIAESLEVLTRIAAFFAVKAGMPPAELTSPDTEHE